MEDPLEAEMAEGMRLAMDTTRELQEKVQLELDSLRMQGRRLPARLEPDAQALDALRSAAQQDCMPRPCICEGGMSGVVHTSSKQQCAGPRQARGGSARATNLALHGCCATAGRCTAPGSMHVLTAARRLAPAPPYCAAPSCSSWRGCCRSAGRCPPSSRSSRFGRMAPCACLRQELGPA